MNRREVLRASLVGLVAVSVPPRLTTTYGYLDVDTARSRGFIPATVILDGMDISNDCCAVDDRAGYVVVMQRNALGQHYLNEHHDVAKETRYGVVTFIPNGKRA